MPESSLLGFQEGLGGWWQLMQQQRVSWKRWYWLARLDGSKALLSLCEVGLELPV